MKKSDVTSSTAATESVLTTTTIDVTEGRDVATIDVSRAFLTADMDKEVMIILENETVDAMLEIDKEIYGKYIRYGRNGKIHMYVCLSKAMYITLKEALMYYRKLSKYLREYGFFIKPYDPCVANKWTSEGQLTVVCHVDDTKVLYKNKEEVTNIFEYMKGILEKTCQF